MTETDTGNAPSVTDDLEKSIDEVFHLSQVVSRTRNESVSDGKHVRLIR